jgi:hypothetical protein
LHEYDTGAFAAFSGKFRRGAIDRLAHLLPLIRLRHLLPPQKARGVY